MSITFPISLPTKPAPRSIKFTKKSAISMSSAPSSFVAQTYVWPGQSWGIEMSWPPGVRVTMEPLVSALASLNGMEGSVLLGDTVNPNPRGSANVDPVAIINAATLNGGFETAGGPFANWTTSVSSGGSITRDTAVFDSGAASMKVSNPSGSFNKQGSALQNVLVVGRVYFFTLRAKTDTVGVNTLRVTCGSFPVFTALLTNTFDLYQGTFTATDVSFGVGGTCILGSSFWIDTVTLDDQRNPPLVDGAGQTGNLLNTKGWSANFQKNLMAGDWLQLGSGNTSRLYKVLQDANVDFAGKMVLPIWPRLRTSPADNDVITIYSPKGRFMLLSGDEWDINEAKHYGVAASFVEDLRP